MSDATLPAQRLNRTPSNSRELRTRLLGLVAAVTLVVPVYIIDRVTGSDIDVSGLYLLPVVLVAYWFGMVPGLAVAGIVLLAEVFAHPSSERSEVLIHALTHAATYSIAAFVTARLRSQLKTIRRLEERRDYDLELARRIQQTTRRPYEPTGPSAFDVATRRKPAVELGGDYVLVTETTHGLFICIADISGHGVPAALFDALLQDALTTALTVTDDPEKVVAAVNRRMYQALPPEMFITTLCIRLSDSSLRFVNAGHEPGLLKRLKAEESLELCSTEGMPVGVHAELQIPATEVPFEAGDGLLLFTDGVTDSPGFSRDVLHVKRFFDSGLWPTADEAADAVIAEAEHGGQAQPDDMTVVVVKVSASQSWVPSL